jgi:hypothetical protein
MTKSEAFARQAGSDLDVFDVLAAQNRAGVPECHPLHYLQMAAEKVAKAHLVHADPAFRLDHFAFTKLYDCLLRADIAAAVGYQANQFEVFADWYVRARPLFSAIEALCPAVHTATTDAEYPWQCSVTGVWVAPADHQFGLLNDLRTTPDGALMVRLIRALVSDFHLLAGPSSPAP